MAQSLRSYGHVPIARNSRLKTEVSQKALRKKKGSDAAVFLIKKKKKDPVISSLCLRYFRELAHPQASSP